MITPIARSTTIPLEGKFLELLEYRIRLLFGVKLAVNSFKGFMGLLLGTRTSPIKQQGTISAPWLRAHVAFLAAGSRLGMSPAGAARGAGGLASIRL